MVMWTTTLTDVSMEGVQPHQPPTVVRHIHLYWAIAITLMGSLICTQLEKIEHWLQKREQAKAAALEAESAALEKAVLAAAAKRERRAYLLGQIVAATGRSAGDGEGEGGGGGGGQAAAGEALLAEMLDGVAPRSVEIDHFETDKVDISRRQASQMASINRTKACIEFSNLTQARNRRVTPPRDTAA